MTLNENLVALTEHVADAIHDDRCAIADLQDQLDAEAQARAECCTTLTTALDNERAARIAGDAELDGKLDAERQARMDGDTILGQRIDLLRDGLDAEADARVAADALLSERILAEVAARASGDAQLSDRLTVETLNRENADDDLQAQIDKLKGSSAVIDVVATKAALNAYPTTDLTDNDIIFVKTDESAPAAERNAMAFYRYAVASGQWTLVFRITPKELADRISNTLDSANPDYSTMLADAILSLLVEALGDKLSALSQQLQAAIAAAVADAINRDDALARRIADLLKVALGLTITLTENKAVCVATSGNDYPTYQDMIAAGLMTVSEIPSGQVASDIAKDAIVAVYGWGSSWDVPFASIDRAAYIVATYFNLGGYTVSINVAAGVYGLVRGISTVTLGAQTRTTGRVEIHPRSVGGVLDAVYIYNVTANGFVINATGPGEYALHDLTIIGIIPDVTPTLSSANEPVRVTEGSSVWLYNCNIFNLDYNNVASSASQARIYGRLISSSLSSYVYLAKSCSFIAGHLNRSGNNLTGTNAQTGTVVEYSMFYINDGTVEVNPTNNPADRNYHIFGKNYVRIAECHRGASFLIQSSSLPYRPIFTLLTDTSSMPELINLPIVYNGETLHLTVQRSGISMPVTTIDCRFLRDNSTSFSLQKYLPGSKLVTDSSANPIEASSDPKTDLDASTYCSWTWTDSAQSYGSAESYYPANFHYND